MFNKRIFDKRPKVWEHCIRAFMKNIDKNSIEKPSTMLKLYYSFFTCIYIVSILS